MRIAKVFVHNVLAGELVENEDGYKFTYYPEYAFKKENEPISLTMPLTDKSYTSRVLFPFFDGLIPEGWLLNILETNWKINYRDRMGLLLASCRDCIGAVTLE